MFKLKFHNDNVNTLYSWSIVEDLDDDGLSYKHVFEVNTLGKVTHTCFVNDQVPKLKCILVMLIQVLHFRQC